MITIVKPAGPIFFCAPAYIIEKSETLIGSESIADDISQTIGLGIFGKRLPFDGTGPSKTLTTLGINQQANQKSVDRNATAN